MAPNPLTYHPGTREVVVMGRVLSLPNSVEAALHSSSPGCHIPSDAAHFAVLSLSQDFAPADRP